MLVKLISVVVLLLVMSDGTIGDYVDDEQYVDTVIDMLLNGVSAEIEVADEVGTVSAEEPILTGGVWKCGECDDLNDSKLMYSEVNEVDNTMITDTTVDIQIGITLPQMRCVTVNSNEAGVVRRIAGACSGDTVTLSVSPAQHFVVQVYN